VSALPADRGPDPELHAQRPRESSPYEIDRDKMAAARLWASVQMPYLASAVFAAGVIAETDTATISIDLGWQLHADPAVVDTLSVPSLGRLILHLIGHVVRSHGDRALAAGVRKDIDRAFWTRCADAEINDDLPQPLISEWAPDTPEKLGFEAGRLAEDYFAPTFDSFREWDCGSGADGAPRPGDEETGRGIGPQERRLLGLQIALEIKSQHAREPGSVPGGWERWAESILPSRTDWRRLLASEIRRAVFRVSGQVDYSYRRPSRRAESSPDLLLPSMHRPVPEIAIVCDTSNSMSDELLGRALSEIEAVLARVGLRNRNVSVLAVDTAVQAVQRAGRVGQLQLAGGGGTDMDAGIAAAAALHPRPSVVIVLTDGFTPWPQAPPRGIRVIVGLLKHSAEHGLWEPPDWARVVEIDEAA
jgi:predicted metal-dependent peptidase